MNMNKVKILGYSERGVFNSIVFYLREHPELMGKFLKVLGIGLPDSFDRNIEYTLLNEQSFSDFGDSDLVIIAENEVKEKAVIFIEGKVKTSQGSFSLDTNFDALEKGETFDGFSSNIFVQLYYKCLLTLVLKQNATDTSGLGIKNVFRKGKNNDDRKIGGNEIVLKAAKMIKGAEHYYFVAILPLDITSACFQRKFKELPLEKMPINDVRCAYWGKIEELFNDSDNVVTATFFYNKGQIY
jgi:hypothetical protein